MAYNERLAFECVCALSRAFPEEMTFDALLKSSAAKAPEAEWLLALDALEKDELVSGAFIRSGHPYTLKAVVSVRLTQAGREWARKQGILGVQQLEQIADLMFEQTRRPLYEHVLSEEVAQIKGECAVHGLLRSSVFVRRVADAVYRRLEALKEAFVRAYLEELKNSETGITAYYEQWLQEKLDRVWEPELTRARAVAMELARSTGFEAREVAGIVDQIEIKGRLQLKKQLIDQIKIARLRRTQPHDYNERMTTNREAAPQPSVTIIYNLQGAHARVNIQSTDASVNVSNVTPKELFATLRAEIQTSSTEHEDLLNRLDALEEAAGTSDFGTRYQQFVAAAANHMTLLAPFLPALMQFFTAR